ncbi:hypothetical protein ACFSQJ_15955 [Croceitalea marina]|uniref:Helix-turn-helix domain-containing protein n=1 Tax=Croceitalea marina TaxID=1775166 RepID=A0ABW5N035_9FLAO
MESSTQVFNITPEQLIQQIDKIIDERLSSLEVRLNQVKSKKYISRKEASNKLQISYVTLNEWDKNGILKKRKIGNKVFYLNEEIETILEQSVVK